MLTRTSVHGNDYAEFESVCPHCGKMNYIRVPKGQHVARVYCEHCPHGFEYTHIVQGDVVQDSFELDGIQRIRENSEH